VADGRAGVKSSAAGTCGGFLNLTALSVDGRFGANCQAGSSFGVVRSGPGEITGNPSSEPPAFVGVANGRGSASGESGRTAGAARRVRGRAREPFDAPDVLLELG
jgi:hypothetical protein